MFSSDDQDRHRKTRIESDMLDMTTGSVDLSTEGLDMETDILDKTFKAIHWYIER